jgi:hypothetical protein
MTEENFSSTAATFLRNNSHLHVDKAIIGAITNEKW